MWLPGWIYSDRPDECYSWLSFPILPSCCERVRLIHYWICSFRVLRFCCSPFPGVVFYRFPVFVCFRLLGGCWDGLVTLWVFFENVVIFWDRHWDGVRWPRNRDRSAAVPPGGWRITRIKAASIVTSPLLRSFRGECMGMGRKRSSIWKFYKIWAILYV